MKRNFYQVVPKIFHTTYLHETVFLFLLVKDSKEVPKIVKLFKTPQISSLVRKIEEYPPVVQWCLTLKSNVCPGE